MEFNLGDMVMRDKTGFRTYRDEVGVAAGYDSVEKTIFVAYYDGYSVWIPESELKHVGKASYQQPLQQS